MTTEQFIQANADGDIRRLALQHSRYPDVDMAYALEQIAGRQTARAKLPSWAAADGMKYPPRLSMEQCSSERTALYKAAVARRLGLAGHFVDLTGGFGVDFSFISRGFASATYVERQEGLCDVASANFRLLGLKNASVVCADGIGYLHNMARASLIYVDPARRDAAGGRTFAIADCTPDVHSERDMLLSKADCVMIKLSPMLDWRKAVADMGDCVREVHIVSVDNECKELLLILSRRGSAGLHVYCSNDGDTLCYEAGRVVRGGGGADDGVLPAAPCRPRCDELPGLFLHEPNASIMKAGCFTLLEERFGVCQIGRDSHLFVSAAPVERFPGRRFLVDNVTTMNKKELRRTLSGVAKANVTVRNFPITVAALRKRLGIGEGGDIYMFATTLADGTHVLLLCSKSVC